MKVVQIQWMKRHDFMKFKSQYSYFFAGRLMKRYEISPYNHAIIVLWKSKCTPICFFLYVDLLKLELYLNYIDGWTPYSLKINNENWTSESFIQHKYLQNSVVLYSPLFNVFSSFVHLVQIRLWRIEVQFVQQLLCMMKVSVDKKTSSLHYTRFDVIITLYKSQYSYFCWKVNEKKKKKG